jgi:hypothetical protein
MAGPTARVHPGKRKANPMMTRNGKTRLGPLNLKQLEELKEKTQQKKTKAKISREIARKQARLVV